MTRPGFGEKVPNFLLDYLPNFRKGKVQNIQSQLYNVAAVKLIISSQMVPCLENLLQCCCGSFSS